MFTNKIELNCIFTALFRSEKWVWPNKTSLEATFDHTSGHQSPDLKGKYPDRVSETGSFNFTPNRPNCNYCTTLGLRLPLGAPAARAIGQSLLLVICAKFSAAPTARLLDQPASSLSAIIHWQCEIAPSYVPRKMKYCLDFVWEYSAIGTSTRTSYQMLCSFSSSITWFLKQNSQEVFSFLMSYWNRFIEMAIQDQPKLH